MMIYVHIQYCQEAVSNPDSIIEGFKNRLLHQQIKAALERFRVQSVERGLPENSTCYSVLQKGPA